ncbi:hypothetical protein TSUD_309790 [Trifolium subterraneum]|uniref:Uncharacterized protein n=1 Tax=Trifolium subterraneum TaxID=3900 RepID=A0A2Z6MGE2_TRISU|nr:hypothetical protein TSUD_309790 [Trifolium subterraneum]
MINRRERVKENVMQQRRWNEKKRGKEEGDTALQVICIDTNEEETRGRITWEGGVLRDPKRSAWVLV